MARSKRIDRCRVIRELHSANFFGGSKNPGFSIRIHLIYIPVHMITLGWIWGPSTEEKIVKILVAGGGRSFPPPPQLGLYGFIGLCQPNMVLETLLCYVSIVDRVPEIFPV